ncbi:MAG: hypothetical protein KIPDCIKN_04338 [Haliscomenobacter sp.]|nr:hypothetical protein [Haliscomenobacter sp.]
MAKALARIGCAATRSDATVAGRTPWHGACTGALGRVHDARWHARCLNTCSHRWHAGCIDDTNARRLHGRFSGTLFARYTGGWVAALPDFNRPLREQRACQKIVVAGGVPSYRGCNRRANDASTATGVPPCVVNTISCKPRATAFGRQPSRPNGFPFLVPLQSEKKSEIPGKKA